MTLETLGTAVVVLKVVTVVTIVVVVSSDIFDNINSGVICDSCCSSNIIDCIDSSKVVTVVKLLTVGTIGLVVRKVT